MTSRATRLLRLTDLLRGRRVPLRGAMLAAQLGISLRTLYRDIAALRDEGAEIAGDPGVGYLLRPGFLLPSLMLGHDELEALLLGARWVSHQADPVLAHASISALSKITAHLPENLRLACDTSGLFAPRTRTATNAESWLPALRLAMHREHVVQLRYRAANDAVTERRIWPFAMAFYDQARLVAGWCELRGDFRHFRADRIEQLADTGERYPARRHLLIKRWRTQNGYDLS